MQAITKLCKTLRFIGIVLRRFCVASAADDLKKDELVLLLPYC